MTCCTGPCAAAAHFNPKKVERDLRRYQRRGPDATTRILLSELRRWPLQGLHLLDVGGGIGVIAVELAGCGLARKPQDRKSPRLNPSHPIISPALLSFKKQITLPH